LAAQLAPAYLRVGGTLADKLIFQPDWNYSLVKPKSNLSDKTKECAHQNMSSFNMTGMCRQ